MLLFRCCICAVFLLTCSALLDAQPRKPPPVEEHTSALCFNPRDTAEVRLWDKAAPGAVGTDPCCDIPFLRVFRAQGTAPAPAILLIPGGGYDKLTDAKEQAPVAEFFAHRLHVTTFLLRYRLVQPDGTYRYPVPMWDGQRALRMIRAHAREFGVDPNRIGVFGFSAGGHLAAMLALHSAEDFGLPHHDALDPVSARPALLALGYPVISMDPADVPPSGSYRHLLKGYHGSELAVLQNYLSGEKLVTPQTPPVFLFESLDDAQISPQNSLFFVQSLRKSSVPVDAHLFSHGVHGAGLAQDVPGEEVWPEMFHCWLISLKFLH